MQWNSEENAGFTTGTPWIKVNKNYKEINAEKQIEDENSVYNFYRALIQLRHEEETIVHGEFELLMEDSEHVFAYRRKLRETVIEVFCNFTPNHIKFDKPLEKHRVLIGNYQEKPEEYLRPYEAIAYKLV